jgi:2-polyprenyl-3-methyl-5-hydroxy-6-metoxy-1,4-benzoquinol methylase/tRNA A-37 threonylcarbamoyl transferase component Bud32
LLVFSGFFNKDAQDKERIVLRRPNPAERMLQPFDQNRKIRPPKQAHHCGEAMKTAAVSRRLLSQNNEISIDDDQDGPCVIKRYVRKPINFRTLKYSALRWFGRETPVKFHSPQERRDFERDCIFLWKSRGFAVADVVPSYHDVESVEPTLHLQYIEGVTLDTFLNDPAISTSAKLECLSKIFEDIRRRHCFAIFENEHRLIHPDSNLRNMIVGPNGAVTIDFESGDRTRKIDDLAAREVRKLAVEICNALGLESPKTVCELLFKHYGIRHVLRRISKRLLDSQKRHIERDQKLKATQPKLVTKIDLARALERRFQAPKLAAADSKLLDAINSSWDGKLYQTLSDNDPRGRDMSHRYRVMEFPDDFSGKSLLDIGCNLGRVCLDAERRGAVRTVGIDYRQDVMDAMNEHCRKNSFNSRFFACDVNEGVRAVQQKIGDQRFDYVCALSIWSHVNQQSLWDIINTFSSQTCFFEDNSPSRVRSLSKIESTLRENLHFDDIRFLGFTIDRGVRAVFRLHGKR